MTDNRDVWSSTYSANPQWGQGQIDDENLEQLMQKDPNQNHIMKGNYPASL